MNRCRFLLAMVFAFCAVCRLPAQESASKPDPIIGHWIWLGARDVIVNADGTAKQPGEATAEWKVLHTNNTNERKYEFTWNRRDGHIYIHTVILSPDGQRLEGRNQLNNRIWAKRIK